MLIHLLTCLALTAFTLSAFSAGSSFRGAHVMINEVTLSVSFPVFGNNYYSQPFESRKVLTLVFDKKFEALLIPAAANHFNNEVVGLNDQFRFLNDVLAEHLLDDRTGSRTSSSVHLEAVPGQVPVRSADARSPSCLYRLSWAVAVARSMAMKSAHLLDEFTAVG